MLANTLTAGAVGAGAGQAGGQGPPLQGKNCKVCGQAHTTLLHCARLTFFILEGKSIPLPRSVCRSCLRSDWNEAGKLS